jgi:hypothetical protein
VTVPGEHDEVGIAEDPARGVAGLRVVRHGEADEAGGVGDHCRCHAELGEHLLGEHRAALLVFGPWTAPWNHAASRVAARRSSAS